ncbi:MAG: cytochrome B [Verrucomicrobia bacterium]|nr:cytochrome B [Verrucomicrobiota bacterium]
MSKPKIAIFDMACCEGCQLQIVNMEEEILELLSVVDPVEWREAISDQSEEYDIAIIEGSVTRHEDEEKVIKIRERAKILIALGACATMGGVNKLKNNFEMSDVKKYVYADNADDEHLNTAPVKAIDEVVTVDFKVHGCPIDAEELTYVVRCLLAGKNPIIPNHPVCVECKLRENVCRYEYGEVCLGPLTRAGCDARCPSNGFWCFGCRGFVDEPNVAAAKEVMAQYGKTMDDLKDKLLLFNSKQEATDA